MWRVNTSLTMNHCLHNSIAFGALGKDKCYLVVTWAPDRISQQSTCFFPSIPDGCLRRGVPSASANLCLIFIQDLFGMETAPHMTRIRFSNKSQHDVYEIFFPFLCRTEEGHTVLGIDKNETTRKIAVKIFHEDHEKFIAETKALEAIKPFYYLGSWSPSSSSSSSSSSNRNEC